MHCSLLVIDTGRHKVAHQMQCRLRELEPLPELLRSTELRLQQTTEELTQFRQFHDRDMTLINDLTAKVTVTVLFVKIIIGSYQKLFAFWQQLTVHSSALLSTLIHNDITLLIPAETLCLITECVGVGVLFL